MDAYDAMIEAGHAELRAKGVDFTPPPAPKRKPYTVGQRVCAMPDGSTLDAAIVTALEWKQRGMQCPYDHPPQWCWEWRITVMFSDGKTREGITREWVSSGRDLNDDIRPYFEAKWPEIEAKIITAPAETTKTSGAGAKEFKALRDLLPKF